VLFLAAGFLAESFLAAGFLAALFLVVLFFAGLPVSSSLASAAWAPASAGSSSPGSSPRADFAAATDFCSAANRSTTSPADGAGSLVRLTSPPSSLACTSAWTASA
jgi:hypothetical protein